MAGPELQAVTGAFGYSGKCITQRLLDAGHRVITLTNSLHRPNPFGTQVTACPFNFEHPEELTESLRGVSVLYNTYWTRFNRKTFGFADAFRNTSILLQAAKAAGVRRVVHISITNPDERSPLPYFHYKAKTENLLVESGLSYAILRPAILFGKEDILINNIAWTLRKAPIFLMFGNGQYRLQPIHVDDLAALAVEQGPQRENTTVDAIGPETFVYRELVQSIAAIIGKRKPIISVPPALGYMATSLVGKVLRDIVTTREEIQSLMTNLLCVNSPPAGTTRLTDWAKAHANSLGREYARSLTRRRNQQPDPA